MKAERLKKEIGGRVLREEVSARSGLIFLFQLLTGDHSYSNQEAREYYLPKHPFTDEEGFVTIFGDGGVTADIGPFVRNLIKMLSFGPKFMMGDEKLTIFLCERFPGTQDYNLYFQENITESMVGGCTNYSGEGGRGAQQMVSLFLLLNELLGIPIEIKKIDFERWKRGYLDVIVEAVRTAWEEETED